MPNTSENKILPINSACDCSLRPGAKSPRETAVAVVVAVASPLDTQAQRPQLFVHA
jgi:hypothetical protein